MNILLPVISLFFIVFITYRLWCVERSIIRRYFWPAWWTKMIAGLVVGLLYTYHYETGDTFTFFRDGARLAMLAKQDISEYLQFLWYGDASFPVWSALSIKDPRAIFMTKFVSVVNLFTANNYWVTSLYFSFVSFLGSWFLVRTIIRIAPAASLAAAIAFLFFPTVVVWSSGIIKESLAMPCLFFLAQFVLRMIYKRRITALSWILLPVTMWVLWGLKYYYLGVFLPVAVTAWFISRLRSRYNIHWAAEALLWVAVISMPMLLVSLLHYNFDFQRLLQVVVHNNELYTLKSRTDNIIHYHHLEPTVTSVLVNTPLALLSGLFRPFIWEGDNVLKFFSGIENLFVLCCFLLALRHTGDMVKSPHRTVLFAIVVYTVILTVFLSLSTPNLGTLVRYRIGYLPFFVWLILIHNTAILPVFRFAERLFFRLVRMR